MFVYSLKTKRRLTDIIVFNNGFICNFQQCPAKGRNFGAKPNTKSSKQEHAKSHLPNRMKSVFQIRLLGAILNEVLDNAEIVCVSMREPLRIVQDQPRISL